MAGLLAGRAVVVVGGSRGIGRAVAELLCDLGAGVVVNGCDPVRSRRRSRRSARREGAPPRCPGQQTTNASPRR